MSNILIRPHHILCMMCFEGKGYSKDFIENMSEVISKCTKEQNIQFVKSCDMICSNCPNRINENCLEQNKVLNLDTKVVNICGLVENKNYSYNEIILLATEKIINSGKFEFVCSDCEWFNICKNKIKNINLHNMEI